MQVTLHSVPLGAPGTGLSKARAKAAASVQAIAYLQRHLPFHMSGKNLARNIHLISSVLF